MSPIAAPAAGDPAKLSWDYLDLAAYFDLSVDRLRKRLPTWPGFPQALPYSGRPKRWRTSAVVAWAARHETHTGARPPQLQLIQGGR